MRLEYFLGKYAYVLYFHSNPSTESNYISGIYSDKEKSSIKLNTCFSEKYLIILKHCTS